MACGARLAVLAPRLALLGGLCWSTNAVAAWTITLELRGDTSGGANTGWSDVVGNVGTMTFGSANTLEGTPTVGGGTRHRVTSGTPGTHFVGTFIATITFQDGPGCPGTPEDCVPMGQTGTLWFYQVPASFVASRTRFSLGTAQSWLSEGAGTEVPQSQTVLQAGVSSGQNVVHQIAIFVTDSDVAGAKSTGVQYVATVP